MIIELLKSDKEIITLEHVEQIPDDLSGISSVQVIGYTQAGVTQLEKLFGIDASMLNHGDDIEISSHYLEKEDQLAFNFTFPYFSSENGMEEVVICFILKEKLMFSFMAINFEQFIPENQKQKQFDHISTLPFTLDTFLLMMIGIISDYFADLTEVIAKNIKIIYSNLQKKELLSENALDEITKLKFNNFILKESLNKYRRILLMLRKSKKLNEQIKEAILMDLNDLTVINEYVQNNFERLDDLKEYVSNKVDMEQNRIFKTLTIVTVCISLPMLVAGIYGMNFKFMPELEWAYGYTYVIILLLLSFLAPLIWFKWKKWL
ncbi:CorA family divalent cation transporter [Pedobacter miscanthi]|uniref:CorA family divalent cation transporter n=1 Tax=Pedobacter miscanthi TaxID=2259170 RepID=UPI00292E17C8|nr:CorA family divalent cation transporter [Pedobacter miscanthi]